MPPWLGRWRSRLANFSIWMCPNERTSCSAIAASASQVPRTVYWYEPNDIRRIVQHEPVYRQGARTQCDRDDAVLAQHNWTQAVARM